MREIRLFLCAGLMVMAAHGQAATAPLTFEVASIKAAAPQRVHGLARFMMPGGASRLGARVDGARAEYTYMSLRDLIQTAYDVKEYQISGPDWLGAQRFDIVAKLPAGSSKEDAPQMLRALLEERFKLSVRRQSQERVVLGLVLGKGGLKMRESLPAAPSEDAPLPTGQSEMSMPEGTVRGAMDGKGGGGSLNMGAKGVLVFKLDIAAQSLHLESAGITMEGLADTLTLLSRAIGATQQVKDLTGLAGRYQLVLDLSLGDLMNMARAGGRAGDGAAAAGAPAVASDPMGTAPFASSVQALGLRVESRRAPVDLLIVEHVEKTPTEN